MPLEIIESVDPLAELITFETSSIYEMIISLRTLLQTENHPEWVAMMRERLPAAFWDELNTLYAPYKNGSIFFELAVDYPNQEDVPGFIEYVRQMDPVTFMFYVVGRILSKETVAATGLDFDTLDAALMDSDHYAHCMCLETPMDALMADVPAFQARLADFWAWYWNDFFKDQIDGFRPTWQHSLNDKKALLHRKGGQALFDQVSNRKALPKPLPDWMPVTEIRFVPLNLIPVPVYMFYGYGNVTLLFDSERTEERLAEIERDKEDALAMLKALGDNTRLDILRLITNADGHMHGKKIAAHLDLSPSAVSRHLTQLRDAKLIVEETHSDRTITYQIQAERLQSLPQKLRNYLTH
ncbi:ArsR/SmtB family transcription factor [Aggregatilinea lenta]|uniref:ArsR/SmtB family transcription factor n=1 Tax=Aggregatilinea lenta TaxID=913108 RepID=UPI000E5B806A|nr:metalloregulator ArsR/SmtB family transcription factor [Aggregatilinea lenta]